MYFLIKNTIKYIYSEWQLHSKHSYFSLKWRFSMWDGPYKSVACDVFCCIACPM